MRHSEARDVQKPIEDSGAKPAGVAGVYFYLVIFQDFQVLFEFKRIRRCDKEITIFLEMPLHIRKEDARVWQVLYDITRNDYLKFPSEVHGLDIADLYGKACLLHVGYGILIDIDTKYISGLPDQRAVERLMPYFAYAVG